MLRFEKERQFINVFFNIPTLNNIIVFSGNGPVVFSCSFAPSWPATRCLASSSSCSTTTTMPESDGSQPMSLLKTRVSYACNAMHSCIQNSNVNSKYGRNDKIFNNIAVSLRM